MIKNLCLWKWYNTICNQKPSEWREVLAAASPAGWPPPQHGAAARLRRAAAPQNTADAYSETLRIQFGIRYLHERYFGGGVPKNPYYSTTSIASKEGKNRRSGSKTPNCKVVLLSSQV
jgi:hypothetical protein